MEVVWWGLTGGVVLVGGVLAILAARQLRWVAWAAAVGVVVGVVSAILVAWAEFGWRLSGPALMFADQSNKQAFWVTRRLLWTEDSLLYLHIKLVQLPVAVGRDLVNWVVGLVVWPFYAAGGVPASWPGAALGTFLGPRPVLAWAVWFLQGAVGGIALVLVLVWFVRLFNPGGQRVC